MRQRRLLADVPFTEILTALFIFDSV